MKSPLLVLIVILISICRKPPAHSPAPVNHTRVLSDDNNMLLGNPTGATHSSTNPENYLIDHKYYIESYNVLVENSLLK